MNKSNNSRCTGWTVVGGQKKKYIPPQMGLKTKDMSELTPQDIYFANTEPDLMEGSDTSIDVSEIINNMVGDVSSDKSLKILGDLVSFSLKKMSSLLKQATDDISNIKDDQETVIYLNRYISVSNETRSIMNDNMEKYNDGIDNMESMRSISIENIQKFLTLCGIVSPQEKEPVRNTKTDSISEEKIKNSMSYASAIGLTSSSLVIEKQPVKIVNTILQPKTLMVDTGIVDINMPVISKFQDSIGFTLNYLDKYNTFVIRMGDTIFNAGSSNFVDLKNSNGRTKHAKRCLNPQPCQYKNCRYYHDPCITYKQSEDVRNFALSYVLQMLDSVKDNTDILENKSIRDPTFVRDLTQLGGTIILKAAQIKALHFTGRKL